MYSNIMNGKPEQNALSQAIRLLSNRAHSRAELDVKLQARGFNSSDRESALGRLEQLGLIDDIAFGRCLMESIAKRTPGGMLRTKAMLIKKGVPEPVIDDLLESYDQSALCTAAAAKKMRTLSGTQESKTKKVITFLRNRGFEWQVIRQTLSELACDTGSCDQEEYSPST